MISDVGDRQGFEPGGGELQGQRDAIELLADPGNLGGVLLGHLEVPIPRQ